MTFTCAYRPLSFCHNYRCLDVTTVPLRNDNYLAIESSHWPFLSVKTANVAIVGPPHNVFAVALFFARDKIKDSFPTRDHFSYKSFLSNSAGTITLVMRVSCDVTFYSDFYF